MRDRKIEPVRLGKVAVRPVAEKSVHFRMVERNLCSYPIKIRVQNIPLQLQCFIRMPLLRSKTSCHGHQHHNVTSQALDPFSSEIDCHLDQTRTLGAQITLILGCGGKQLSTSKNIGKDSRFQTRRGRRRLSREPTTWRKRLRHSKSTQRTPSNSVDSEG